MSEHVLLALMLFAVLTTIYYYLRSTIVLTGYLGSILKEGAKRDFSIVTIFPGLPY